MSGERGQASVELLGALPAILLLGAVILQLLAVGYSAVLAGNAAEAGALALAGGGNASRVARESVPELGRGRMKVSVERARVEVTLRPPSLLAWISERLEVSASAAVPR